MTPSRSSRNSLDHPGKEDDWRSVYEQMLPRVYYFFCYRVGDDCLAEDLTATTFEKAWRGRKRYRKDRAGFSSWLFGIARHVAADYFRLRKEDLPLDAVVEKASDPPVEEAVQRASDFERLSVLLLRLADQERELISLKYGADLTNRQIAHFVGLSETNVGTILYRTVNKLRSEWEAEG